MNSRLPPCLPASFLGSPKSNIECGTSSRGRAEFGSAHQGKRKKTILCILPWGPCRLAPGLERCSLARIMAHPERHRPRPPRVGETNQRHDSFLDPHTLLGRRARERGRPGPESLAWLRTRVFCPGRGGMQFQDLRHAVAFSSQSGIIILGRGWLPPLAAALIGRRETCHGGREANATTAAGQETETGCVASDATSPHPCASSPEPEPPVRM